MNMKELIEILSKYRPELDVLSINFNRCTDNDIKIVLYDANHPSILERSEPLNTGKSKN